MKRYSSILIIKAMNGLEGYAHEGISGENVVNQYLSSGWEILDTAPDHAAPGFAFFHFVIGMPAKQNKEQEQS